jgi:hypothetical protein
MLTTAFVSACTAALAVIGFYIGHTIHGRGRDRHHPDHGGGGGRVRDRMCGPRRAATVAGHTCHGPSVEPSVTDH